MGTVTPISLTRAYRAICHAVQWGVAFLFILPNIPYFRNVFPVQLPQGFSTVFYRFLDGCKTLPFLLNALKSNTNEGDIMGYNEQWSFSMESYSKSSKLP